MFDRVEHCRKIASKGGRARAESLPAHRRKEIAQRGFNAMVFKYFQGDRQKAIRWLTAKGLFAQEPPDARRFYRFPDPGPFPGTERE